AVADDQFALAAANWHHGVNGFQAGLHRLVNTLAFDNTGSHFFDSVGQFGVDRTLAVDGVAEGIHYAAFQLGADGDFEDTASTAGFPSFNQTLVVAQYHGANGVALEVEARP